MRRLAKDCVFRQAPRTSVERPVETDNDEFIIVGPARADMSPDAERKVVVIQNADVPGVQDQHVFNCGEGESENLAETDIAWRPSPGDVERVVDLEKIDQECLLNRFPELLW